MRSFNGKIDFTRYLVLFGLISCPLLLMVQIFTAYKISVVCQNIEFLFDIVNIILGYVIYISTKNLSNQKVLSFFISVICLFLVDVWYYVVYSLPHLSSYVFIFDSIHLLWYATTIVFLFQLLIKYVLNPRQMLTILSILMIVDLVIFSFFSINIHYVVKNVTTRDVIQIIQFIAEFLIFDLAILWLVYAKRKGTAFIAAGLIILSASEFMITSSYMSKIEAGLDYAELLWMFGIIFISLGMITNIKDRQHTISEWFRPHAAIRSKLIILSFGIAITSFIVFFLIIQYLAIINHIIFVFFPTIIMMYSLVIIYFSVLVGNAFELPFAQIQNDIESLLTNETISNTFAVKDYGHYSEVKQIEQQIKTLISLVNKQSQDAAIGLLAREIAHDIQSPLSVLQYCKDKISNIIEVDDKLLKSLKTSIDSIKYILVNLLNLNIKQSHRLSEESGTAYTLLHDLIDAIAVQKSIEYHDKCDFKFEDFTDNKILWLFINPEEFKNKIANLINNAFEATESNNGVRYIHFSVSNDNELVRLKITDNGCGISSELLDKIKQGYSTKADGNGIGLRAAIKFFEDNGGQLTIESIPNKCTTISVQIKLSNPPSWFPTTLELLDHVVILDDDPSIHYYIQSNISKLVEVKYFTKIDQLQNWFENNLELVSKTTFFIDFYIENDRETGLDLINKYNIDTIAYLLTNEYSIKSVQENVIKSNIKMLPKTLIGLIANAKIS